MSTTSKEGRKLLCIMKSELYEAYKCAVFSPKCMRGPLLRKFAKTIQHVHPSRSVDTPMMELQ